MNTVETSTGTLGGVAKGGVTAFKGVPFTAPPVGPLRFRPPQPATPWTGVRDAGAIGKWSPQPPPGRGQALGGEEVGQSEDCLTLNVWTPATDTARRPVMVWFHGGGFTGGSGGGTLYDGTALAHRGDVVVVTVNYRLGVLGFAAHPDLADEETGMRGNWGMLDQIAALAWVRDNIAGFGGDPGNVTIFGESAGGMSVSTLLGMPAAKGLFHKAIAQSGGPLGIGLDAAAEITELVAKELGLSSVAALRDVPAEDLVRVQAGISARHFIGAGLPFVPVIDGLAIPTSPLAAVRDGHSASVPLMAGTTTDESRLFAIGDRNSFELDHDGLLRRLERMIGPDDAMAAAETYAKARADRGEPATPSDVWFAVQTDHIFRIPCTRMLEAQAAHQPDTYGYLFAWPSPALGGILGSCHALELGFLFGTAERVEGMAKFTGWGRDAERLSGRMQDAWTAFARSGNPAPGDLGDWPAYEPSRRATMVMDRTCRVELAPMEAERAFWDRTA
jgi:para-nitrobenzyl esterase